MNNPQPQFTGPHLNCPACDPHGWPGWVLIHLIPPVGQVEQTKRAVAACAACGWQALGIVSLPEQRSVLDIAKAAAADPSGHPPSTPLPASETTEMDPEPSAASETSGQTALQDAQEAADAANADTSEARAHEPAGDPDEDEKGSEPLASGASGGASG